MTANSLTPNNLSMENQHDTIRSTSTPAAPIQNCSDVLVCPVTKTPLRYDAAKQELISEKAGLAFPIREGIPIMLVDEARKIRKITVIPAHAESATERL